MADGKGGGGCLKLIGCGCAVVLALIGLVAIAVMFNWDRIMDSDAVHSVRRTVAQGRDAMVELHALEGEMSDAFDAAAVHLGATFDSRGRRVQVTIVDPVLPEDADPAWLARQVAVRVGQRILPIVRLDEIQVTIEQRGGGEGAARSARQYTFPISSLPELEGVAAPVPPGAEPSPAPSPEAAP